jgi:hypothetical protein
MARRRTTEQPLGRGHSRGSEPVSANTTSIALCHADMARRTTSIARGPSSALSPAQRIRMIGLITLGATSITAVIGVWMRYQGYTLRGIWAWMGRTTGIFGGRAA